MSARNSSTPPKAVERVYVGRGLDGLDDYIDVLESYFREMQKTSVETAYGPEDFLSFVGCAHYFGVIMIETQAPVIVPSESNPEDGTDEDAEGEPEEETLPVSRATSPPSSITHSPISFSSPHLTVISSGENSLDSTDARNRSEQERDQRWEKYFQSDLQKMGGGVWFQPEEDPNAPFFPRKIHPADVTSDRPHSASTSISSMSVDDCLDWSDVEGSTEPVIQQGSSKFYRAVNNPFRPPPEDPNFGREYLEPVQFDSPSLPVQPIETIDKHDPNLEARLRDAALHFRGELRSNRIRAHELVASEPKTTPIGLIYLSTAQNFMDPLHMGECSMGLYIAPDFRGKRAIINAINDVTEVAFNNHECHRLQSIVVDSEDMLPTLKLLASAGFRKEGNHRRAFYSNAAGEWKDVTYFSMLATDWVYDKSNLNSRVQLRPKSLWDDLLSRHQRECEDLVRLEEKHVKGLKRVASTETVRESLNEGDVTTGHSQRALQKRRRIDSVQESNESISIAAPPISDSLLFSHSPEPLRHFDTYFPLRPRKLSRSDSVASLKSDSSFSNISATSDWEILEDESIGQFLRNEDTATKT